MESTVKIEKSILLQFKNVDEVVDKVKAAIKELTENEKYAEVLVSTDVFVVLTPICLEKDGIKELLTPVVREAILKRETEITETIHRVAFGL